MDVEGTTLKSLRPGAVEQTLILFDVTVGELFEVAGHFDGSVKENEADGVEDEVAGKD